MQTGLSSEMPHAQVAREAQRRAEFVTGMSVAHLSNAFITQVDRRE
jgi:hypothetical protein